MVAKPKPVRKPKAKKKRVRKPDPDYFFSLCVRERADWTCENCGKKYEPWYTNDGYPANPGLHCSHYIGRANYAVRFDAVNANAHCYSCHTMFEGDPDKFQKWKRRMIGDARYELLILWSQASGKPARQSKAEIEAHYRAEFEAMREERNNGRRGYLPFEAWHPEPQTVAEAREQIEL